MIIYKIFATFYIIFFAVLVFTYWKVLAYDTIDSNAKKKSSVKIFISFFPAITASFLIFDLIAFYVNDYNFPGFSRGANYFENYHKAVYLYLNDHYFSFVKIVSLIAFIFITLYYFTESNFFFKYAKKIDKNLEIYDTLTQVSFSVLSFSFYPILKAFDFLISQNKIGTFRFLIDGNEVIRDMKKSEKRLRIELIARKSTGFKFYKELRVPKKIEVLNILIVGGMGAGKTVFIAPITLQFYESKYPSLIVDNKGDFSQLLSGKEGVIVFSPFDARSPFWAIAEDIETELEAIEFVAQLIPVHGGSNDVFALAARDLTLGAIKYLQKTKPKKWAIGEVLATISSEEFLRILEQYHPGGVQTLKDCSYDPETGKLIIGETSAGFFQNVRAYLQNFDLLSKAWPISEGGFSVKKWLRGERKDVLFVILSFKQLYKEISGFFCSMIVNSFLKECQNMVESRERRIGLFLDEIGAIPRINLLADGLKLLRGMGVCTFAGVQEVGVIRKKYEVDGGTEVLLNGFSLKLIGRAETAEYAEYFQRLFTKNRYKKVTRNKSIDSKGRSSISTSEEEVVEDAIATGEFTSIPPASLEEGAIFYVKTSEIPVIFKLRFPVIPFPRPYPASVEADWIKNTNIESLENQNINIQVNDPVGNNKDLNNNILNIDDLVLEDISEFETKQKVEIEEIKIEEVKEVKDENKKEELENKDNSNTNKKIEENINYDALNF